MDIAKVFMSGRSQAVRLPKEYRFDGEEVYINKIGASVVLIPKEDCWENLRNSLELFPDDYFSEGRVDLALEDRENIDG